ncbi:50S ribosomal protein L25/general stress protein Ctc [Legionella sp. PC997]|uniref:50S ribosomal protein L25/general stress protein Ctc n=1 Tax=Legionella sp. PC997 TaxID=2755562 RepID=UPI0015FB7480|nr:50S ribosomal protein L25/general stress protein Ctc [Legionella sp. PC997]QMT61160.1 50S ribosomal protein L25 [Legionella sp. PC997]
MSNILLEAQARTDMGKGASRRLRRLENKVPAVIYGGDKKPMSIHFQHNKVVKALETESIYSSVFDITVDGKVEHVILKALQRHPYKPVVMHMDLQRVSKTDILVKLVPIHFINEEKAPGIKAGGIINHTMTQVEIRCQAKDLPEFISVDMSEVKMDDIVHLSHLKLPKGVQLTVDVTDGSHDAPVVSIHMPRGNVTEEEANEAAEVSASAVPTVNAEKNEE